jgi:hypothetical protein
MLPEMAARSTYSAPASIPKPPPSPRVIMATPTKPTTMPVHPLPSRRSARNATARRVVKMGIEAMIRLAAPALAVICP